MMVTELAVPSVTAAVTTAALFAAFSLSVADASAIDNPTSVTEAVKVCVAALLVPSPITTVKS